MKYKIKSIRRGFIPLCKFSLNQFVRRRTYRHYIRLAPILQKVECQSIHPLRTIHSKITEQHQDIDITTKNNEKP